MRARTSGTIRTESDSEWNHNRDHPQKYLAQKLEKRICEPLADLRNISCTMMAIKVYELYVLDWLKSEVKLRSNRYRGVRGKSTDHILVQLWQNILKNLDGYRTGTVVTSIDYSKAFNIMTY